MTSRFVPPHPPRGPGPVPVWRGLIGERAHTAVFGWSEQAFTATHIRRKVLGFTVIVPLEPDAIQRVLLDNAANYEKPGIVKKLLAPTIGEGLLTADGTSWREQRRIVAASFAPGAVDHLVPVFAQAAEAATIDWPAAKCIDMAAVSTATTMRVIAAALFSGDPRLTSAAALAHIAAALEGVGVARLQALFRLPLMPVGGKARAGRRGQVFLRRTLGALVGERLRHASDDFLARLISSLLARFNADEAEALAIDNAATFYLAGHETTANALAWTLFLLSEQPELQEQVAAEAQAALGVHGKTAALPDHLPLLRQVLEESMRLYPPVPRIDREAVAADRLGDVDIAPGDIVSVWPWLIHRHKAHWEDADAFDPGRFAPERRAGRHRFQYLPFGGGPRSCVGARFAMAEALTILAVWLSRWRFTPVAGHVVRVSGLLTLRPAGGLPLAVQAR